MLQFGGRTGRITAHNTATYATSPEIMDNLDRCLTLHEPLFPKSAQNVYEVTPYTNKVGFAPLYRPAYRRSAVEFR